MACVLLFTPPFARADTPTFDRPGISFSPSVLPVGSFDWEQGLPDMQRDDSDGVRTTTLAADTTFRFGIATNFELQLSGSAWNHERAGNFRANGAGDLRLAVKWAPTLANEKVSLGVMAAITSPTGNAEFSNGESVYSLGATVASDLGGDRSIAGYANLDRSGGQDTWTLSTNFGFPVRGNVTGYVEAGRVAGSGDPSSLAGGGLTWLLKDRVQLDVYGLRGLTRKSPDLLAGAGVSFYWP